MPLAARGSITHPLLPSLCLSNPRSGREASISFSRNNGENYSDREGVKNARILTMAVRESPFAGPLIGIQSKGLCRFR